MIRPTLEFVAMLAHLTGYGIVSTMSYLHGNDHYVPYVIITFGTIIHVLVLLGRSSHKREN